MSTTVLEAVLDVLRGEQFADRATAWERAGAVPREDVERLAGHGLLGMTVGTAHHGSDLPLVDVTEVHRLVGAASPSLLRAVPPRAVRRSSGSPRSSCAPRR
ncbi:acyl-CoA dehydrogenase family protein [Streptomyces albiflaviniger]|nr:acyl-CoA dehydrogenase family protein [Streptomyces albiflaviniger]